MHKFFFCQPYFNNCSTRFFDEIEHLLGNIHFHMLQYSSIIEIKHCVIHVRAQILHFQMEQSKFMIVYRDA
jgi:hypothetical protein